MDEEEWSSELGFIFAAIGSAVGLGNMWRFPISVHKQGGGAYMIPYILTTFALGLPLMIVSIAAGKKYKDDIVSTVHKATDIPIIGWGIASVGVTIQSFYYVITGWTIAYLFISIQGFEMSFSELTNTWQPLIYFFVAILITLVIISLGITEGIEKVVSIVMPFIFLTLVGLSIYAFTLSSWGAGMEYFLAPDFDRLTSPDIWDAALGQSLFSLSLGTGILLTYGIHLGGDMDVGKSSVIIAFGNFFVAILAGMIIFPLMFSQPGLDPGELGGSNQLLFTVLPGAFESIPYGQPLGIIFFVMMFVASLSTAISMTNVTVTVGMGHGLSRKASSVIMVVILAIVGLPSALSWTPMNYSLWGTKFFTLINDNVGFYFLPITTLIIAIGLVYTASDKPDLDPKVEFMAKYFVPPALLLILLTRVLSGGG
ncbi:MAG: sodium-dependent transporter [Halobacteria archaeon]